LTKETGKKVLLIGFGNPAREDDGIGPAVAEIVENLQIEGVTVDSDYQLTVEDSAAAAEHDIVIFVDASIQGEGPFTFEKVPPRLEESFSSHSVEPEMVIGLAEHLFRAKTEAYILGIRGYSFEMFTETMTAKAVENMGKAVDFLIPLLKKYTSRGKL